MFLLFERYRQTGESTRSSARTDETSSIIYIYRYRFIYRRDGYEQSTIKEKIGRACRNVQMTRLIFIDLKKLSILLIVKYSAKSSNFIVFKAERLNGSHPIFLIGNSLLDP